MIRRGYAVIREYAEGAGEVAHYRLRTPAHAPAASRDREAVRFHTRLFAVYGIDAP